MTKLNWYDNILQGIAMKMVVAVHGPDQGRSEWVSESMKYIKEVLRPAKAQTNKQTNNQRAISDTSWGSPEGFSIILE